MNYDFSQLNDKEFEIFVTDLLSASLSETIERFKPGKDAGVDGRYFTSRNGEAILQCKHYLKTGYQGLIKKLNNEEKQKVKDLDPSKYIFITSLPLSRNNKKEIRGIFSPYIQRDDDVIGQEDLNALLYIHPNVEEKHFKLWISSTTVLKRIINNAIKGRSEYELEQIQKKSYRYVQTKAYDKALQILKSTHVLIITGEPGIGKTTLAENICLYFSSKDFEFVDIEDSLSDAENIYTRGKKQIFYFDDFLGSNYFEAITNKKDSHIVKFINRVKNDGTKLFVLTSRTNILNSGILHSSVFSDKNIQQDEYLLTIKSLTQMDRARILYNHIWFSGLTEEYIDEIYKNKRYTNIIYHNNYNPRLIEFITDVNRISETSSKNYWEHIENTLQNPKDIWANCFKIQNNSYVRNLVGLTVFNGGNISEIELREGFNALIQMDSANNPSHTEKDFDSTSQLATKSFLHRYRSGEDVFYSLFNPSISDFVLSEYCKDNEKLSNFFRSLRTVQSLKQLISLRDDNIISEDLFIQLSNSVFDQALRSNRSYDYQILVSHMVHKDKTKRKLVRQIITKIVDQPTPIDEFTKFLSLLTKHFNDLKINNFDFIWDLIHTRYLDEAELIDFAEFVDAYGIESKIVLDELKMNVEYSISSELSIRKTDVDLSGIVEVFWEIDGDEDIRYDESTIEHELSEIAYSLLDDYHHLDIVENLNIDINSIVSDIDIDEMVQEYVGTPEEPDYKGYHSQVSDAQNIDDLFERT